MPKIDFETVMQFTQNLPSLPQSTLRALQMIDDPGVNIPELANVISMDQTLAARVLRWANSPFYGLRYKVSTPRQAIMAMGTLAVRDLLLTVSVSDLMNRKMLGYGMNRGALWQHSIAVAAGAQWLAKTHKYSAYHQAFIAGLLHDIGKLVLDELLHYDESWHEEWVKLQEQGVSFMELERWLAGMDHAQLGGKIAEEWNLPEVLVEAISCHHEPHLATVEPQVTQWVHIADAAAMMLGVGLGYDGLSYVIDSDSVTETDLDNLDFEALMEIEVSAVTDADRMFT